MVKTICLKFYFDPVPEDLMDLAGAMELMYKEDFLKDTNATMTGDTKKRVTEKGVKEFYTCIANLVYSAIMDMLDFQRTKKNPRLKEIELIILPIHMTLPLKNKILAVTGRNKCKHNEALIYLLPQKRGAAKKPDDRAMTSIYKRLNWKDLKDKTFITKYKNYKLQLEKVTLEEIEEDKMQLLYTNFVCVNITREKIFFIKKYPDKMIEGEEKSAKILDLKSISH